MLPQLNFPSQRQVTESAGAVMISILCFLKIIYSGTTSVPEPSVISTLLYLVLWLYSGKFKSCFKSRGIHKMCFITHELPFFWTSAALWKHHTTAVAQMSLEGGLGRTQPGGMKLPSGRSAGTRY